MKQYEIKLVQTMDEINNAPLADVDCFPSNCKYRPVTSAAVVYVENQGFLCRMRCLETEPKAVMTEPDSDTYKDSCMEWFINFNPSCGDAYLNLEANSLGTLHCKFGKNRYFRYPLSNFGVQRPTVSAIVNTSEWFVDFFIPNQTVQALFKVESLHRGNQFRGNFYKCGDETLQPHYGMWNRVKLTNLDFHRPEFFGTFILV